LVNMENAIECSRKTLLVLTPAWVKSEWSAFESLLIQTDDPAARHRRMIPLRLQPCQPPKRIAMLTYIDFTRSEEWQRQLDRLIAAARRESQPSPLEPPRFWRIIEFGAKWNELVQSLRESHGLTPEYQELYKLINTIRVKLGRTYGEDERFDKTKDWQEGIVSLEGLSSFNSQNPKLQSLLMAMKFELARLFLEAAKKKFYYQKRWQETFLLSTQALTLNRNYSEALRIEAESREQLERADQKKEKLYEEAIKYLQREQWRDAAGLLKCICRIDPDYRDTRMLLDICNQEREA